MKKGQSVLGYKGLYFIISLFALTFIFLYMHSIFAEYQAEKVQCVDAALEDILIAKVLYSDCFSYKDPNIQQSLPGTIDTVKFNQQTLDTCFSYLTKRVNISIEGKNIGEQIYNPVSINKTIWFYENTEQRPSTIQFTFEEHAC